MPISNTTYKSTTLQETTEINVSEITAEITTGRTTRRTTGRTTEITTEIFTERYGTPEKNFSDSIEGTVFNLSP